MNLTGIVDEKIAAALANSVQKCSLVALSINFTTKDYSFSKLEDILDSFMYSKHLLHLELTNFCVIQKKESLMHIDLFTKMQCQFWQLPSNVELLQSWCILFLFHVLTKHCCTSGLGISVYKHLKDGLMKKGTGKYIMQEIGARFIFRSSDIYSSHFKFNSSDGTLLHFISLPTTVSRGQYLHKVNVYKGKLD